MMKCYLVFVSDLTQEMQGENYTIGCRWSRLLRWGFIIIAFIHFLKDIHRNIAFHLSWNTCIALFYVQTKKMANHLQLSNNLPPQENIKRYALWRSHTPNISSRKQWLPFDSDQTVSCPLKINLLIWSTGFPKICALSFNVSQIRISRLVWKCVCPPHFVPNQDPQTRVLCLWAVKFCG